MDRIITIPQSATLTAPFTQGSLWQGAFERFASKPYVSQSLIKIGIQIKQSL